MEEGRGKGDGKKEGLTYEQSPRPGPSLARLTVPSSSPPVLAGTPRDLPRLGSPRPGRG